MGFYQSVIGKLLERNLIGSTDRVLVICAGSTDRQAFLDHDFKNVVISNLITHGGVSDYSPYLWEYQDAEAINHEDAAFDWVFVHAGLHHCASPHKSLCEMLRVASKGVAVFEARDSTLLRIASKFSLVPEYELEPVVLSDGKNGGLRDSCIPNYVYRWTEREVEKTVNSYSPEYVHGFSYHYNYRIPNERLTMSPSAIKRFVARLAKIVVPVLKAILPKQGNEFAFTVTKQGSLQPWLLEQGDEIVANMEYMQQHFRPDNYKADDS